MAKRKKKIERGIIFPSVIPSIWETTDRSMKLKTDIPDHEMKFLENFVKQGGKTIDSFHRWTFKKKKQMLQHMEKLEKAREYHVSRKIAQAI